jgi:bis(5'-adenosyl)-triphosphatase
VGSNDLHLSSDETGDLWITAKEVGARLEQYHKASSLRLVPMAVPPALMWWPGRP